ncbi:MAG: AlkZ family DNA glycosylase [Anaerolineae bacterium]|nr:AlkZ family DNA glycosylase [Anaerolineae bacterium]
MSPSAITRRQINRATLARQLLLDRVDWTPLEAIHQLLGLQAQVPREPYIGLWSRLTNFRREDLTQLLDQRAVVRATLMRSTLHLFASDDYLLLRATLQPALTRALYSFFGQNARDLDVPWLIKHMRAHLEVEPHTFTDLRPVLTNLDPDSDTEAMAYALRTHVPLVQVPAASKWGYPNNPAFATVEAWLGASIDPDANPRALILRYLAAFGPAYPRDVQVWSGLTNLLEVVEALKPELQVYHDERGKEVLDLPDFALPDEDIPAPIRFLPEYDNLILSHADRSRFVPDEFRKLVFLSAGRVRATVLIDGMVAGTWKAERLKDAAALVITPFAPLSAELQASLADEARRLIRFIEEDAATVDVRFESA